LDKSFSIISEGREKHFAPDVVDAFFAAEKEMLAIKEKYMDKGESPKHCKGNYIKDDSI
jgi:response regulator RpfG family c-di-GMP phosphodiesterase